MKPPSQRLPYLDWLRGLAAITMLQGHVFHSFLRSDLRRPGGAYDLSQFAGGMPPAVFLFLLGVTFAFLMDSQERKGVSAGCRVLASMRRSGYLFAVAFLFRLQLWIVSIDKSPWTDLLRVDVLNVMGLSLLILSAMAAFRTVERIRLSAILGLAIALASPVISGLDWSGMPAFLRFYIVPDHLNFGFFPWAAFVAFGLSVGSILRRLRPEELMPTMQWFGWGGLVLAFGCWSISNMTLTVYANSDFWLNSPALIMIKLGVVLMLLAFSYVWTLQVSPERWNWVRQFGMTSLLVYWVHIELVYGRALAYFKENLNLPETLFMALIMILAMLGLSVVRTYPAATKAFFRNYCATPGPAPDRISGD
jgi:uncharacterized membrane protein